MTLPQAELIERLRALLGDQPSTREVSMFGGKSFMVQEKMVVSALKGGDLLVRVSAEQDGELLNEPGASRAEMGEGRSMGAGWILVDSSSITSDDRLSFWLSHTLKYNQHIAGHRG